MEKSVTVAEVQEFILTNGSKMTNEKMAKRLKISRIRVAGGIAALKRLKVIDKKFLLTDTTFSVKTPVIEKTKKAPKPFTNYNGVMKEKARGIMVKAIKRSKIDSGKVLCLPAEKCMLEIKIRNEVSPNFSYDFVEQHVPSFGKMLRTILKEKLSISAIHNCEMAEVISKAKTDEYSHLILDYCTSLDSIYAEVKEALRHKIVKAGGIVTITFCQRYRKSKIVEKISKKAVVESGESRTMNAVRRFIGKFEDFEIVKTFSYKEFRTPPMMLLILKRVK